MTDTLTTEQRRLCMSKIRGRNTRPELQLRKAIWQLGMRYRINSKLPGKPDLVVHSCRAVVFVDGCFWHQCPMHSSIPKTNRKFWKAKLLANVDRDRRITLELRKLGWNVFRVWEHSIMENPEKEAIKLHKKILSSGGMR